MVQIDKARHRFGLEIPTRQILGYVTDAHTGTILGFLGEWIEACPDGRTLNAIDLRQMPRDLRGQWAEQIEEAVEDLHALGILWGDCKPVNVIIDEEEDVRLIDLGGSFTQGWVDPENSDTLRGDEQGVNRIVKYLRA